MFENCNGSTKKKGNVGVARAISEYARLGYDISIPMGDYNKYDMIVDIDGRLYKTQCKTSASKKGINSYAVQLGTTGSNSERYTRINRKESDYDLLFILLENGRCWSIPVEHIKGATCINVGDEAYSEFEIISQLTPVTILQYINKEVRKSILDPVDTIDPINIIPKMQLDRIERVKNCNIDFLDFGWVTKAAALLNMQPQRVNRWMKKYMLNFYINNCYKRKRLENSVINHVKESNLC